MDETCVVGFMDWSCWCCKIDEDVRDAGECHYCEFHFRLQSRA